MRSGSLNPAFLEAQKRAEMLRPSYILGDPQHRGAKSEVAASPLPFPGPSTGRICYVTTAFSGVPNEKLVEQNGKWLPQPCLLRAPK